jgi:hypothetical protein
MSDESEFTALKMAISRQMFPVAHAIANGQCDSGCNGPAVERPGNAAYHWQRFQDAVMTAWASRAQVEDSRSAQPVDVQALNDAAYDADGHFIGDSPILRSSTTQSKFRS